jgi:hypothetical protein
MAESLNGQDKALFANDFSVTCTNADGLVLFLVTTTTTVAAAG